MISNFKGLSNNLSGTISVVCRITYLSNPNKSKLNTGGVDWKEYWHRVSELSYTSNLDRRKDLCCIANGAVGCVNE